MTIVNFTPWSALLGGALIGLAAALLLFLSGRIAGISGIAGGAIYPHKGDVGWRLMFVIGLVLGGFLYQWSGVGPGIGHITAVVDTPLEGQSRGAPAASQNAFESREPRGFAARIHAAKLPEVFVLTFC